MMHSYYISYYFRKRYGRRMGNTSKQKPKSSRLGNNEAVSLDLRPFLQKFMFFRGAPGILEQIEIDTANFMGNYPESAEVHAIKSDLVSIFLCHLFVSN